MSSLARAQSLKIKRYLTPTPWKKAELHVFVDASEKGFGAVGTEMKLNQKNPQCVYRWLTLGLHHFDSSQSLAWTYAPP